MQTTTFRPSRIDRRAVTGAALPLLQFASDKPGIRLDASTAMHCSGGPIDAPDRVPTGGYQGLDDNGETIGFGTMPREGWV